MNIKKVVWSISAVAAASVLCAAMAASAWADGDIGINEVNFPDDAFREYVKQFDSDNSGGFSQAELDSVAEIIVDNKNIGSLKGVEYFTQLTALECYFNRLTSLDVNNNTALKKLICYANQLTSLDLSGNTELEVLWCGNNPFTSLDVSGNTALTQLSCYSDRLTSLDVSSNTALQYLWCGDNPFTSLDVSKNTALSELSCYKAQLTSLDISNNTALLKLDCHENQLTGLDVSNNTALTALICDNNQITELDVSRNTELTDLRCFENRLTELDVSKNTALTNLVSGGNPLKSLDVSKNTALQNLNCYGNDLTSLDVSSNTALEGLHCPFNRLSSLDVSKNTALNSLNCSINQLTSLDLSSNTDLVVLQCSGNQLRSLDLSKHTYLTILECYENQLTSLDLSKNTFLEELNCADNSCSIELTNDSFSLADLPAGFDPAKASEWNGAEYDSSTNTLINFTGDTVTYTYDCGNGHKEKFTLKVSEPDPVSEFVERLYTQMLARPSEAEGKADWVSKLSSGATATDVASGFVLSEEIRVKNLSNEEFVTRMYRTFMDRDPDEGGLANWVNALDGGCSYAYVLNSFVLSEEFGNICKGYGIETGRYEITEPRDKSRNLTAFTSRMYTKALGRAYEVEGLNYWTGRVLSGDATLDAMAHGFIFSAELNAKNLSDEEFVDTLYATFFDRPADEAGKSDWLGKLDRGEYTREQVLDGFLGAQEFADLVKSFEL